MTYRTIAAATVVAIAIALVVVAPFGEYAVDDDWAYVRSLTILQHEGRLEILEWNPMSLVGHLLWGWLFTSVFGLSFTVTKLAVVATFLIECLTFVALLRHFRVPAVLAAMATATVLFQPLHFFHAFQFTTDVPTAAWSLVALLLYVRALDAPVGDRVWPGLAAASVFAGLAFLVRQSGGLVAGAVLVWLLGWGRGRWRAPGEIAAALGPATVIVLVFTWWYHAVHGATATYTSLQGQVWTFVTQPSAAEIARGAFVIASYVGLFVFPLSMTAVSWRGWRGWLGRRAGVVVAAATVVGVGTAIALGVTAGLTFPYLHNKLTPFGFMRPNEFVLGARPVVWPPGTSWLLTLVTMVSAAALLALATRARAAMRAGRAAGVQLVGVLFALQVAYGIATTPILFDRHLLPLLPTAVLLCAVLARGVARPRPVVCTVLLLPLAWYALAGTHDVHAVSRTAFAAGRDLVAAGISPHRIDGGYGFDGWYTFGAQARTGVRSARPDDAWWVRVLFPTIRTDYVVALSPTLDLGPAAAYVTGPERALLLAPRLDRYRVVREYSYARLWPWGTGTVYVLADEHVGVRSVR
jgi:hypothetical protein